MKTSLFLSLLFFTVGVLTLAFRNRPNPYIGVRFGYTYLSKEAWRRANSFAAIYCLMSAILFFALSFFTVPKALLIGLLIALISALVAISYKIAKESYEREDLSMPTKEMKPLEKPETKGFLLAQIIPVVLYLLAVMMLWDELPNSFAIHFNISFKPDSYASKEMGAVIIPLISSSIIPAMLLLISKEPMLIRFPVYGKGQKSLFCLLTAIQFFIVGIEFYILLFNAGIVGVEYMGIIVFGFVTVLILWIWQIWRSYKINV